MPRPTIVMSIMGYTLASPALQIHTNSLIKFLCVVAAIGADHLLRMGGERASLAFATHAFHRGGLPDVNMGKNIYNLFEETFKLRQLAQVAEPQEARRIIAGTRAARDLVFLLSIGGFFGGIHLATSVINTLAPKLL